MAIQKAVRPATVATVREPQEFVKPAKADALYATSPTLKIQAAFVASRFSLPPARAALLAHHAFGEVAR